MHILINFYTMECEYQVYTDFRTVENFEDRLKEIQAGYDKIKNLGLTKINFDSRENILTASRSLNEFELELIKWNRIYYALSHIRARITRESSMYYGTDLMTIYNQGIDAIVDWYLKEFDEGYHSIEELTSKLEEYKNRYKEYLEIPLSL